MRRHRGFTMIELVVVMILVGILATTAIPRMVSINDFRARAFHDDVVASLRFAQKTAVSHRRLVCATFTAGSVSFNINPVFGATACGAGNTGLALPSGGNQLNTPDAANVAFNPVPGTLFFQSDGTITTAAANLPANYAAASLSISGQSAIAVAGATGYVK
jgi:MSHA pilin protein MshC